MTKRALIVVDVQKDFCEGGSLAVAGGNEVAKKIRDYLVLTEPMYDLVLASKDWHDPDSNNGGHIEDFPDFINTWPSHCIADTEGAEFNDAINTQFIDVVIRKGQGKPAYSAFEGTSVANRKITDYLDAYAIDSIDVVGIATDYCVLATALDSQKLGYVTRVLTTLTAGVAPESTAEALFTMRTRAIEVIE